MVDLVPRRAFLTGAGCTTLSVLATAAHAASNLATLAPTLSPHYKPVEKDELGLWGQLEKAEDELKNSNFLIKDAALNNYLSSLCCKLAGDYCPDIRVYVLRTPYFNASMAPNGMMQIWSGLLLRVQNEAQLAAVLGHEISHYLRQHSIKRWRDVRNKTSVMSVLSVPVAVFTAGFGAIALNAMELMMIGSIYSNSRDDEREADAYGLKLIEKIGLMPDQASSIWQQLVDEKEATAKAQGKKTAKSEGIFFNDHPQSAERLATLAALAKEISDPGKTYETGHDRFMSAVGPHRAGFFEDQLKLEDFGGTQFLLSQLARDGWSGELLYYKGELLRERGQGSDYSDAIAAYRDALTKQNAPAETNRGLGYALLKTGDKLGAQLAFRAYLTAKPAAMDRAMIEYNLQ